MKNYVFVTFLALGMYGSLACVAQVQNAANKEQRIDKKEQKSMKKDERANEHKGDKKQEKALKKSGKIDKKAHKDKYDN